MTVRTKAESYLLATTLIWGGTFVAMKIGLEDMSAMLLIAIRFGIAAVLLLLIFSRKIFPVPSSAVLKGGVLGFLLFLGFVAQTVGLNYTTASKSAFITSMMVVFTPLFQLIIERRAPTLGNILGVLVVCIGLWLLTSPTGSVFNMGDALTLGCAVMFGLYLVYLDIVSKEFSALQLTFLQVATCAVLAWSIVGATGSSDLTFSGESLTALAYLTLLATLVTTLVQTRYQKDTTPTRAAVIFSVEPVLAAIYAYFLLNERIGEAGVLGGGLIVVGILISEISDSVPGLRKAIVGPAGRIAG